MILVIDNGSIYTPKLVEYLDLRNVPNFKANKTTQLEQLMKHKFKGVILSGGPLLYSSKKINIEDVNIDLAVLLDLECPFLGICFGHQTIIEAFGGKLARLDKISSGMQEVEILKKVKLFEGLPNKIKVKESHSDCATKVPFNFDLIATSNTCKVEAIKHKTKPIYGVQFHPEASGEVGYRLLDNFLKICKIK